MYHTELSNSKGEAVLGRRWRHGRGGLVERRVAGVDHKRSYSPYDLQAMTTMEGDPNSWQPDPMRYYRSKRDAAHQTVASKYKIVGFISSGTYGRVYKAINKDGTDSVHAIKKFKPDKEGDVVTYTGISQSAIREIAVGPHPRPT